MADRNQNEPKPNAKSAPPANPQGDESRPADGISRNPDPESDRATTSRPRGHTEEADRTL